MKIVYEDTDTMMFLIHVGRFKKPSIFSEDDSPITVAAMESGFQSVRSFNDVYKKNHQHYSQ